MKAHYYDRYGLDVDRVVMFYCSRQTYNPLKSIDDLNIDYTGVMMGPRL